MAESDGLVPAEWVELLRGGGVARIGARDLRDAEIESWAAATDRSLLYLDTEDASTERELLAAFGEAFDLDEDAECEWDGIDECLGDYDISPTSGLVIVWSGWDGLDDDPDHVLPVAVDALQTAARAWADEGRPWAILMAGDGPSWELPWLGFGPAPWEAESDDEFDDDDDDVGAWEEDEIADAVLEADGESESSDQLSNW